MSPVVEGCAKGTGRKWRRREVRIADEKQQLLCKLWDAHADVDLREGQVVKVLHMVTDHVQNFRSVGSTAQTRIEVHIAFI